MASVARPMGTSGWYSVSTHAQVRSSLPAFQAGAGQQPRQEGGAVDLPVGEHLRAVEGDDREAIGDGPGLAVGQGHELLAGERLQRAEHPVAGPGGGVQADDGQAPVAG